jgi:hypothetical protein
VIDAPENQSNERREPKRVAIRHDIADFVISENVFSLRRLAPR